MCTWIQIDLCSRMAAFLSKRNHTKTNQVERRPLHFVHPNGRRSWPGLRPAGWDDQDHSVSLQSRAGLHIAVGGAGVQRVHSSQQSSGSSRPQLALYLHACGRVLGRARTANARGPYSFPQRGQVMKPMWKLSHLARPRSGQMRGKEPKAGNIKATTAPAASRSAKRRSAASRRHCES